MSRRSILKISISVFLLAILSNWIIEPISLNMFSKIVTPISNGNFKAEEGYIVSKGQLTENLKFKETADSILNQSILSNNFLGLSVAVYKKGWGQWLGSAGYSSKRDQNEVNDNTLFRLASISKPMTAFGIMNLYEKGLIELDVPIQTYIQNFPKKLKGEITIRQLLMHTSGITHYTSSLDAMSFTNYPTMEDALNIFKDKALEFTPGTKYMYSTYGYTVLGAIIEEVTGLSYQDYMKDAVWEKSGMMVTGVEEQKDYENKARLYFKLNDLHIKSPYTNLSSIYPGGGIQSNSEDMLRFSEAILNNKIVDSMTLNLMIDTSNSLAPAIGDTPNGLGWNVFEDPDYGRVLLHGGSQPGAGCFYMIYLDQKMAISVLSNSYGTRKYTFDMARNILNSLGK